MLIYDQIDPYFNTISKNKEPTMRVKEFCHKLLSKTSIHKKRLGAVSEVVETIIKGKTLSVTMVGRKMLNGNKTRSNIRKVDRLYSNNNLFHEREEVYKAISDSVITTDRPFITVDGSKIPNSDWYILRANLVCQGRGLTIFERQYQIKEQCSKKLYKKFLNGLARVLGPDKKPILITDAEFRGPWFKLVMNKGWDFIGRLRGNAKVSLNETDEPDDWQDVWPKANKNPKCLGPGYYNHHNEVFGYFYLFKGPNKGRHAHTRSGRPSRTIKSNRHKASAREPWLLISSLDESARYIIKAYKFRMSIEENFRDTKSGRYGLGLKITYSKQKNRYAVMLLLAALASMIAYLFGKIGELHGLNRQFQVNSTTNRRVLSRFFLGCEMLYKNVNITIKQWREAIKDLQKETMLCFAG